MKRLIPFLLGAILASCAHNPVEPTPQRTIKPNAHATFDLTCRSGYIIAYDENGNPYCAPDPQQQAKVKPTSPTTVVVPVIASPIVPLDLTRWLHPEFRFYHDNVTVGALVTCNGRTVDGVLKTAYTLNDGNYIDQGTSCLHVGGDVVSRFLFLDDSIGRANPGLSQKAIQDTIAAKFSK